ncbi:FAD:protein FMN transferase [Anaerocolumna sp. AGMB13025]|nr:FAD:protein FMN transferase [Anaerocolumna sp. AGMB13025]WFR57784.1 FAD:protein FMN transferase [Anaerocolumna sp. AGMB13025]
MINLSRKLLACLLSIVFVFNLTACHTTKLKRFDASFLELFDTVTTITGYASDKEEFTKYAQMIYDNLKVYHQLYDIYNDYDGINNIKTINENAGIKPVKVDKKIIDMLTFAKEGYELTGGQMNVAFGAVLSVWHDYRTSGVNDPANAKLPPMDVLKERAKHTDINKVIINEKDSTVYLEDPEMSLDVGAVAKGYATEQVAKYAYEQGFKSGSISVGGNVRTLDSKADTKEPWSIGIQNPDLESKDKYLYILNLKNMSLVTSGVYERYYTVNGKQYHHIIDPDTLMPAEGYLSVSIVTKDSGMADCLAKIINMPFKEGLQLIESIPDTEALWVFQNGEVKYSSHFESYIKTSYIKQ